MPRFSKASLGTLVGTLVLLLLGLSWFAGPASSDANSRHPSATSASADVSDFTILLAEGSGLRLNGQAIDRTGLRARFKALGADGRARSVVRLEIPTDLPMGQLIDFQRFLADEGMMQVAYLGGPRESPLVLPPGDVRDRLAELPAELRLTLRLRVDADPLLANSAVALDGLESAIARRLAGEDALVLVIETEAGLPYGDFLRALEAAKRAGATRIAILEAEAGDSRR